jgi:hypothetical protein
MIGFFTEERLSAAFQRDGGKMQFSWSWLGIFAVGQVFAQAPYFQNKTIKIIRGGTPGGTGDTDAMNRLGSNRFNRFSRSNR